MNNIKSKANSLGWFLFCLGLITCTWDHFLKGSFSGFNFKIHTLFFFCSLALNIYSVGISTSLKRIGEFLRHPFLICIFLLVAYYLARIPWSYFPLKSFLYSGWIVFNALTIWVNTGLWAKQMPREKFFPPIIAAIAIQSVIILIDQVAHGYGYTGGLVGLNQDGDLKWGLSRPSGFSSEPSYIATFLSLSFLLLLPWILKKKSILIYIISALGLFALIASISRTGWLLLAMGFGLATLLNAFQRKKFPWKESVSALALLATIGIIYTASLPATQRKVLGDNLVFSIFRGNEGSGMARLRAHRSAWIMTQDTNYLGTGLGASYWYWITHRETTELKGNLELTRDRFGKEVVMSTWGQLLAEAGLIGPLLYALAAFFLLRARWRIWRASLTQEDLYSFVAAFCFFTFGAFWLGNIARGDIWIWYALWSHLGMAGAAALGTTSKA